MAVLQNIKVEADALKIRLLDEIRVEEALIKASKIPDTNPTDGPPIVADKPKRQKTVSIKSINTESTWRIEKEADVDRYVEGLRIKLKQNIKEDTILNIEF